MKDCFLLGAIRNAIDGGKKPLLGKLKMHKSNFLILMLVVVVVNHIKLSLSAKFANPTGAALLGAGLPLQLSLPSSLQPPLRPPPGFPLPLTARAGSEERAGEGSDRSRPPGCVSSGCVSGRTGGSGRRRQGSVEQTGFSLQPGLLGTASVQEVARVDVEEEGTNGQ